MIIFTDMILRKKRESGVLGRIILIIKKIFIFLKIKSMLRPWKWIDRSFYLNLICLGLSHHCSAVRLERARLHLLIACLEIFNRKNISLLNFPSHMAQNFIKFEFYFAKSLNLEKMVFTFFFFFFIYLEI